MYDAPLPLLDSRKVKLHVRDDGEVGNVKWEKLINEAISVTYPKEKRSVVSYLRKNAKSSTTKIAVVDEKIYIEVELQNPLRVGVQLTGYYLIHFPFEWTYFSFVAPPQSTFLLFSTSLFSF